MLYFIEIREEGFWQTIECRSLEETEKKAGDHRKKGRNAYVLTRKSI